MEIIKSLPLRWIIYFLIPIIIVSFTVPVVILFPLFIPAVILELAGLDLSFGPRIGVGDVMGFYYLPQVFPAWLIFAVVGYLVGKRREKKHSEIV